MVCEAEVLIKGHEGSPFSAPEVLSNYGLEGDVATKVPVDCLSGGQKACLKPLGSFASDASASTPHTDMTWQ